MSSRASSFVAGGGGLALTAAQVAARPRRAGVGGGSALGCKCLFGLGVPELVVIAGVAALLFGPKQLPEIGRNIGKTVKSFQQVRILHLLSRLRRGNARFNLLARAPTVISNRGISCPLLLEVLRSGLFSYCETRIYPISRNALLALTAVVQFLTAVGEW